MNLVDCGEYVVPGHVVSEVVDGETVILNLQTGAYFALNRTGTRIWELIRERCDREVVCGRVAKEFRVDPMRVRADFDRLAQALVERGLLRCD